MIHKLFSNWRLFWPVQALLSLAIALLSTFLPLMFPNAALPLRFVFLWILPAAFGAWSACILSRSGLNSYASWIAPPIVHTLVPWIAIGFLPSPFSMLLCALLSLTGAAAGEVLRKRDGR